MKSILITGAASGIGAAIVKKIASQNMYLTLTTKSNNKGLEEVVEYAKQKGSIVSFLSGDLSNKEFIKDLIILARKHTGSIDQFVSNSGYAEKKKIWRIYLF